MTEKKDSENSSDKDKDVKFLDLFDPKQPRSNEELVAYRLSICQTCPSFSKMSNRCRKCGCFMSLKTTLRKAKCPIDKW